VLARRAKSAAVMRKNNSRFAQGRLSLFIQTTGTSGAYTSAGIEVIELASDSK
jgi:hypothetical protein